MTRDLLKRNGYKVIEAPNGEEALSLAALHAGKIDLMLSDVIMPRLGGRELARSPERVAIMETKVIFMSGYSSDVPGFNTERWNPASSISKSHSRWIPSCKRSAVFWMANSIKLS